MNAIDATSLPAIRRVAVIGAGRIGRSFALACAAAGFDVVLEDVMPANLRRAQEEYAELTAAHGTLTLAPSIEEAVREADLVVDFVPDELESKLEIFCLLDRMAPPRTVLATPTTRLSIADLASCTYRPDRCVAIAQEASSLAEGGSGEIRLRTCSRTSTATVALLTRFWSRLGFRAVFERDLAELMPDACTAMPLKQ